MGLPSNISLQQLRLLIANAIAHGQGPGITAIRGLGFVQQMLLVDELSTGVMTEMGKLAHPRHAILCLSFVDKLCPCRPKAPSILPQAVSQPCYKFNISCRRFYNATNSAVAAYLGGFSGTDYSLFVRAEYDNLVAYIAKTFRYTIGRNLFAAPYDWRYDLETMNQVSQMDKLADRIEAAVKMTCGKKAIIIGHSMGTLVSLSLMQNPRFESWR